MAIKINNIKATGIELTPAIRDYFTKKVALLEKLVPPEDESVAADLEVGKTTAHHQSGDVFRAEINLHAYGEILRAEAVREDLYAAIDETKDEMADILRKKKKKNNTLRRKGGAWIKKILRGMGGRT